MNTADPHSHLGAHPTKGGVIVRAYRPDAERVVVQPAGDAATERLLRVFELEKAVYELRYELDNRPDWVEVPVAGIERLMNAATEAL